MLSRHTVLQPSQSGGDQEASHSLSCHYRGPALGRGLGVGPVRWLPLRPVPALQMSHRCPQAWGPGHSPSRHLLLSSEPLHCEMTQETQTDVRQLIFAPLQYSFCGYKVPKRKETEWNLHVECYKIMLKSFIKHTCNHSEKCIEHFIFKNLVISQIVQNWRYI